MNSAAFYRTADAIWMKPGDFDQEVSGDRRLAGDDWSPEIEDGHRESSCHIQVMD